MIFVIINQRPFAKGRWLVVAEGDLWLPATVTNNVKMTKSVNLKWTINVRACSCKILYIIYLVDITSWKYYFFVKK